MKGTDNGSQISAVPLGRHADHGRLRGKYSKGPGWGPYEHLPPDQWEGNCIGESYRRCCTSIAWVGQALAARLVDAQQNWNHDAFFAYVDRWMDPAGDAEYIQTILDLTGRDFSGSYAAHGQAWDDFVEEMWAQYR